MAGHVTTERVSSGDSLTLTAPGFVGRDQEMAALARALTGSPAVVLIEGEAGIGKTRLLQEFLRSPSLRKRRTLLACCPALETPCTFGPVVDAIRQAADDVRGLGLSDLAGALRSLFPEWARALPPAPEPAADATAAKHRLFRALAELLARLQIGVLAVEDVHWADEATLEFLLFLASRRPRPVSLVVTCRPEDAPDRSLLLRLSRLAAGTDGIRLTLAPLSVPDTASLVSSMLDGQQVSPSFAVFLHERTDGVPLAVEETVRLMGARADLARNRDGQLMRRHLPSIEVPPTVRDAVLERAARLSGSGQAILHAAAILAIPSPGDHLLVVASLSHEQGVAGLCEVLRSGLLIETFLNGSVLISYRHALAARAVHDAIPLPRRAEMHRRAGRVLQDASPPPPARLARHFRLAGDAMLWSQYAEQAADFSLAAGDEATAETVLYDLITQGQLPVPDLTRIAAKIPFAVMTEPTRYEALAQALRLHLDQGVGDGEEPKLRYQLGRLLMAMGDYNASRAELERAVPGLADDPAAAARAMIFLGWPHTADWPTSVHLRWLRRAAAVTGPMTPADRLCLTADRAVALLVLGAEEGWTAAALIPEDAPSAAELFQIVRGSVNIGLAALTWGRYNHARHLLSRAFELTETHHYARYHELARAGLVNLNWVTGAWEGLWERAVALADEVDAPSMARLEGVMVAGLLEAASGAYQQAEERFRHVIGVIRQRDAMTYIDAAAHLGAVMLSTGRAEEALHVTETPCSLVLSKGVWVWAAEIAPVRVRAMAAAGRTEEAAAVVTSFAKGLHGRDAPAVKAALLVCRASLAEGRGETGRAASLFGRAASAWDALPQPYDATLARERQACCQLTAGHRDDGLALLTQVRQDMMRLGAKGAAERVTDTLRQHGAAASRAWRGGRRGYGDQLSPRELEVVRLLAQGQTDRQIAATLFVSPKTVAYHMDSARRKLHVHSRAALAAKAQATGLLPGWSADAT